MRGLSGFLFSAEYGLLRNILIWGKGERKGEGESRVQTGQKRKVGKMKLSFYCLYISQKKHTHTCAVNTCILCGYIQLRYERRRRERKR